MKKIVSAILALCLVLSVSINAFAAAITTNPQKTFVAAGETVSVTVDLDTTLTGVKMIEGRLYYDPDLFTFVNGTVGASRSDVIMGRLPITKDGETYVTLNYVDKQSAGQTFNKATVYTVNFIAKEDIAEPTSADFQYVVVDKEAKTGTLDLAGDTNPVTVNIGPKPELTATVTTNTAVKKSTYTVTLGLKNNPGIVAIGGLIEYDTSVFKLTKANVVNGDAFATLSKGNEGSPMQLNWTANMEEGNVIGDVALATLTFEVLETAAETDTTIKFKFDTAKNSYNAERDAVAWNDAADINVDIVNVRLGDISNDGRIDNLDSIVLLQYLVGIEDTIIFEAADISKDGRIDNLDSIILLQYLVGISDLE